MLGVCGLFKTGRIDSFLKGVGECKRALLVNTECVVSLWRGGEYGDKLVGLFFSTECAEPLMLEECDESWLDSVNLW